MSGRRHSMTISPELESMDLRAVPSALSFSMAVHLRAAALEHAVQVQQQHALAVKKAAAAHALAVKKAAAAHALAVKVTVKVNPPKTAVTAVASHTAQVSSTKAIAPPTTVVVKPAASTPVSQGQVTVSQTPTPKTSATTTDVGDVKNGPLAKAGQGLIALYQDFQQFSGSGTFTSTHAANIETVGTSVRVDIRGTGDVGALSASLQGLGMQVTGTDANTHTVEGLLPIAKLPDSAQLSGVTTISPVYKPHF